ncbi:tetratricopeptide repeat protein [Deltaproteobacteria bacterium TL4]
MSSNELTLAKIEALKEQIHLYKEQNQFLQNNIEDLKLSQKYLHEQMELFHEREKLALLREKRDYQRIVELENKALLLEFNVHEMAYPSQQSSISSKPHHFSSQFNIEDHFNLPPSIDEDEDMDVDSQADDAELQNVIDRITTRSSALHVEANDRSQTKISPVEGKKQALKAEQNQESSEILTNDSDEIITADEVSSEAGDLDDDYSGQEVSTFQESNQGKIEEERTVDQTSSEETAASERKSEEATPSWVEEVEPSKNASDEEIAAEESATATEEQSAIPDEEPETPAEEPASSAAQKETPENVNETEFDDTDKIQQYFNLGLEASERKDYVHAIECFSKVVQLLPTSAPSYLNLAILSYRLNRYEEASVFASKAITLGSEPAKRLLTRIESEMEETS